MKLWCDELAAWRQPGRLRPGAARPAARRQAADGRHHDAAADQDHQAARRRQGHDRHPRLDLRQSRPSGARLPRAHRHALRGPRRSAGRNCSPRSSRRRPGALWTRALIERQRVAPAGGAAGIRRGRGRGRSAGALGLEGRRMRPRRRRPRRATGGFYVLADLTSQGDTPAGWAARVGAAYRGFGANRVVAEINNGGDMVAEVLRQSRAASAGALGHRDARQVSARRAGRRGLRARARLPRRRVRASSRTSSAR